MLDVLFLRKTNKSYKTEHNPGDQTPHNVREPKSTTGSSEPSQETESSAQGQRIELDTLESMTCSFNGHVVGPSRRVGRQPISPV